MSHRSGSDVGPMRSGGGQARTGFSCFMQLLPWVLVSIALAQVFLPSHSTAESQPANPQVLNAKEITLESLFINGPNGERRGSITTGPDGATLLALSDGNGAQRLVLGVAKNGMSFISMKDQNQKYRVTITQRADGSPSISLLDENQSERMRMAMGSGNSPELILLDRNSQARVNLGVSAEGRPSLMVGGKNTSTISIGFIDEETPTISWFSRDDRQRIFISDGKLGPLIALFDKDAVCRTTWAVLPDGTPRFALRDAKGVPTLDFTLDRDGKPQMKDHTK